ncbi:MAG: transporter substrate-binding domain-containing protein [Oscillospiraceae bacterium]|nr:transporter substrate-binding domain-containing protein [Oscillospiraceae bacterium]
MKKQTSNRILTLLLALALLASLCGCGAEDEGAYLTLETLGEKRYSLICRKDDRLAPLLDAAMEAIYRSGRLSAICTRWLGADRIALSGGDPAETLPEVTPTPTPEEWEEAPEVRTLIFGVERDFDPMAFGDADAGTLRGMSVEIAQALAQTLGMEVAWQPISPSEVGTQLSSGNIDCALGFDPGEVDPDKYTVGTSYLTSELVLAVRRGGAVKSLKDIRGERVGTIDDPMIEAAIRADENVTRVASGATVYLTPERCMEALDKGWCAAVAMDSIMLSRMM